MGAMPHKLLLADDSVTIQRVIELTFADEDVQVIAVGNGADAIERAQRDRPDIVLADVGMPERDGYEVAAFIKGTPNLSHIPVVLLTGAFEPVDEGRARAVGCDGVLVKPFEPQLVISRVKDLLAGRQPPGMWGSAPVAQGPVRQAPPTPASSDFDARAAMPAATNDSLEAYFDHLDAAFASSSPDQPAPPVGRPSPEPIPLSRRPTPGTMPGQGAAHGTRANDPFADWDPDLQGDPARPATVDPAVGFTRAPSAARGFGDTAPLQPGPTSIVPPAQPPAAVAAPAPLQIPSLADAFAALLSAEQAVGFATSAAPPRPAAGGPGVPEITDELLDAVATRVLARLGGESRPAILDIAERLVREEIDRIKNIG
jgi:CheY-like chemotaxis protein